MSSWDAAAQVIAGFIQGLDFLLICVYASAFILGCLLARMTQRALAWPLALIAIPLALGMGLATISDMFVNISLLRMLF